jgi:1,4-alpha-glucan branching enzyme
MKRLSNVAEQLRRLPIGAELMPDGVHFRVWAPNAESVDVVIEAPTASTHKLNSDGKGYFSGCVQSARAGTRYSFRLDQGATLYPTWRRDFNQTDLTEHQPLLTHSPSIGRTMLGAACL